MAVHFILQSKSLSICAKKKEKRKTNITRLFFWKSITVCHFVVFRLCGYDVGFAQEFLIGWVFIFGSLFSHHRSQLPLIRSNRRRHGYLTNFYKESTNTYILVVHGSQCPYMAPMPHENSKRYSDPHLKSWTLKAIQYVHVLECKSQGGSALNACFFPPSPLLLIRTWKHMFKHDSNRSHSNFPNFLARIYAYLTHYQSEDSCVH